MSYSESRDEGSESEYNTHGGPSQLWSPSQTHAGTTTRYSASLSEDSAHSIIESSLNDEDSVASIDVERVGFTPRTSIAISESDEGHDDAPQQQQQQTHPYSHAHDPYARQQPYQHHANESIDGEEDDVERMLLSEQGDRSIQYDQEEDYEQIHPEEYQGSNGEGSYISGGSEDDFGPPEWPHVYSVDEIRLRRTRPLSDIPEVRSSVGSRSQASGMLSRPMSGNFSPSHDAPPVPTIPAHFRQVTEPVPSSPQPSQHSVEEPQIHHAGSRTSLHSRASTDPGARPLSTASAREVPRGVRDRIAFFEERSSSPALVHGARPGSPSGTHGLGLGLGLSIGRPPSFPPVTPSASAFPQPPTSMLSPGASSMISTPFSPDQSMPSVSPTHYRERDRGAESTTAYSRQDVSMTTSPRYQSSIISSSSSGSGSGVLVARPASPSKSIRSYHSSEASSIHIPSYASSPRVQPASRPASENIGLRATSALIQSVSDDILSRHLQQEEHRQQQQHSREPSMHEPFAHDPRSTSPLTQQPQTGYVQRILQSLRPVEQESGLFDIRRRQSLRRASGGQPQERSTRNGSQAGSAGRDRAGSAGESAAPGSGSGGAASGRGSAPRSEGEVGSLRGSGDSFEGAGIPGNEEPLRVGTLWYLHVHTGDENFRWIKCKAFLFRTKLKLTWVEAGGGKAIIDLDLLNCNEVRSVPSPTHASARDDIGNIVARRQAAEEGPESRIAELAPFQMLYEDGVERLGAGSPGERFRWVAAIWDALNQATAPSRSSSPAPSIGTIPSQQSSQPSQGSGSRTGSASTVFIPPEGSIPDIGSTISSLTRSSFHSVERTSSYLSPSYVTGSRPRSVDDSGFMSPEEARLAITPSRSSSLRRTSSMTDLDEYASAAAPSETGPSQTGTRTRTHRSHSGSETSYLSQSQFDVPFLPSRGAPSISEASLGVPRTIHTRSAGDETSVRSSPRRPLPQLPSMESLPSISSIESSGRYDTATGTGTGTATGRRYDTASSAGVRSGGTAVPRAPSAAGTTTGFLTAPTPSTPGRTPTPAATTSPTVAAAASPTDSGVIYSPSDSGPVRRVRPGKASSIYSLASLNEQERHRAAVEESSTVDEYGSIQSSPAPSHVSASPRPITPQLLGTAALPRLSYRGPESASMLGDSHAGSPGAVGGSPSSSSSPRSFATPRTPSRLSKIVEMPTGASSSSSAASLVRSTPGSRPRSSRFLTARSTGTTAPYASAEEGGASSSEEWHTASEKTPTKSSASRSSGSAPLTLTHHELAVEQEESSSEPTPSEVASVQTNGSDGDGDDQRPRLARQDSYYTSTSAGLRRERSIGGDSYSEVGGIEVCLTDDLSEITPLSGSSGRSEMTRTPQAATPTLTLAQQPVSVFSSPYYTAEEAPSTPISSVGSMSIPTIRTESVSETPEIRSSYATPIEQVDTSSEYSTAMRWPSSSEYSTAPPASSTRRTPTGSATPSVSVPVAASSSRHTPSVSPSPSLSVPVALSDPRRSPTPASVASSVSVARIPTPAKRSPTPASTVSTMSLPRVPSPTKRSPTPASASPSVSVPPLASPAHHSASISGPSGSSPYVASVRGTPTPSVVPSIQQSVDEISVTSEEPSTESSVTPTQSRTMSLASRSVASSPMSTPQRHSTPRSIKSQSTALPKSTTVSSVSSLSSTTVSSISASPIPSPMSTSSKSLSSVTTSLRTPASFLMPPVPPPSSTRSTRSRPVSEASYAPTSEESMGSSLFEYTPSATSSILPPVEEMYDSSIFQTPSRGSTASGQYEVVLVESSEGEPTASGGSTTPRAGPSSTMSIAMAETPIQSSRSPSSLSRSESVGSVSSLRSSIFLPSRSSSIRSVAPPPSASSMGTPRSPTVSVTMTPAQSFHPSFRDDLSTVPSEEEQAVASAPMEIITHDVNRLLEYLDGVDRQRVSEHDDVKDQLDRLENGLKRLTDFVKEEATKPPPEVPASPSTQYTNPIHWAAPNLPEPTEDVVMHHAPPPAVILLDIPESPLRLSSGSVTESVQWLSSPSSVSDILPGSVVAESVKPSSLTKSASLHPSELAEQQSASIHSSKSPSLRPSDSASQRSASLHPSESMPMSPSSDGSTIRDVRSVDRESGAGGYSSGSDIGSGVLSVQSESESVPDSLSVPGVPPVSVGSTPPPSVPGGSRAHTPLETPPRTRGNTPDISIVSASGRGSPARSDITVRAAVSNAQLRDMLNDLRRQTDRLIDQQNRANEAIEELQNRPPVQLPPLPATPRRSPYADLLSQIADTLRNIVDAGEAARNLPETETETESIAETSDTGGTARLNDLQNQLQNVLGMPAPPRHMIPSAPETTMADAPQESTESSRSVSPPPASLFEQHVADFPRIRRPKPIRAFHRSPSPTILTRPGTAPLPSGPTWGRPQTLYGTPAVPRQRLEEPVEEQHVRPHSGDSGSTIDMLRELQRRRLARIGSPTYKPGGDELAEERPEPIPRPDTAPVQFLTPDEPVTQGWYRKRPKSHKPEMIYGDPAHEPSEPPSPPRSPIAIPQEPRQPSRPTIPLGELPSTASYAEMLALLRQNELMQRHQNEQQNELVRYLHDLNGWLARDVNNRQAELQGVEDRIAHLQNALAARPAAPYRYEQEPVLPMPPRMGYMPQPIRFGDPEGDDGIIPPPGRVPYPGPLYAQPPVAGYPGYQVPFREPGSPPIIPPSQHHSRIPRMPVIEVRGAPQQPSRGPQFRSPSPEHIVQQPLPTTAAPITVADPSRAHSPHSPPRSSQPAQAVPTININIPGGSRRSRSRSPRDVPSRGRRYSRSGSPEIVHTSSRRRSRTPSPEQLIVGGRAPRSSRRGRSTMVLGDEDRRRSRSRDSRTPSPIIIPTSGESRRPRSERRQIIVPGESRMSRSRSRSPERVVFAPPSGRSRRSRSRSPRTVVLPSEGRRRSRSRSPRTVVLPSEGRRRSRSRSPRTVVFPSESRRRSRSPRTVVMPSESRRRSRSPRTVMMPSESRRRSRSPRTIVIPAESGRRRSRSPRRRLVRFPSRSRSRSPIMMGPSYRTRRSRSRSPVILGSRRSRSRSPPVIYSGPSEYSRRRTEPIIMDEGGRRSRGLFSRLWPRSRVSTSPRRVLGRRSRSPQIIVADDPGSGRRVLSRPYGSRSPPIILGSRYGRSSRGLSRRPRSYSPRSPRYYEERRRSPRHRSYAGSRYESPEFDPVVRRPHSYSPSRRLRRGSRSPRGYRPRSRSPRESPPRRSRSLTRGYGSRFGPESEEYRPGETRRGSRRGSPRGSRFGPESEEYRPGETRRPSRRGSPRGPRFGPESEEYRPGETHRSSRRGSPRDSPRRYLGRPGESPLDSRFGPDGFGAGTRRTRSPETGSRRLRERPGRSRQEFEELEPGPPRSARPESRRLTGITLSPPRSRLTRRSRSPSLEEEEEHPPRTHQSGRRSPPITVMVPAEEDEYTPTRPATRREALSTIHEGDSIRTGSPSVIQVPGTGRPQTRATLRVASPPIRSASPSIIRIPSGDTARRGTPQMLRVGTPRTEAPAPAPAPAPPSIIRLPSVPPATPRTQVLRVGTPRVAEPIPRRSPSPEYRARSPTLITLPGQRAQPERSQTIRVGGTPVPTPVIMQSPPVQHPPRTPTIIQLPGQPREPQRSQTIRVGTPLERPSERSPTSTSIIQIPGQSHEPHRSQTLRIGTPLDRISERSPVSPSIIQLPGLSREPTRSQTIRIGTPLDRISERSPTSPTIIQLPGQSREPTRSQTIRVGSPGMEPLERPPTGPSIIRLPGQDREPHRSQTIRVGTPSAPPVIERPPTASSIIRLPGQPREVHRSQTVRVGTPMRQDFAPAPTPVLAPSIIQLPTGGTTYVPQTVRVASPSPSAPAFPEPTVIRLQEQGERRPLTRGQTVRVGSPIPAAVAPSIIQLPSGHAPPERVPTSQLVRVGGVPLPVTPREPSSPHYMQPAEQIIRIPTTPGPQPPATSAFVRVGGRLVESTRAPSPLFPPPTTIQLPGAGRSEALKSPMVRVTAPSVATPATPSIAPPGPTVIRLPGSPAPTGAGHAYVRVPEGARGGLTEVPTPIGTPGGVVRVERPDRTPTVIQVSSPGPTSRFVRATPSPGVSVPGFVRARGAGTPGLSRIPEVVRVGDHTPVPGASRASDDRPHSEHYPEHRVSSIASVGRDDIIAPVASRTSMAGRSVTDTLERLAREADEEAEHRRRRRGAAGLPTDYETEEARRQRQFEEFLEAQRLENERLREIFFRMAPGLRSGGTVEGTEAAPDHISQIVTEAVETIKSHRDADRASIMSLRDDEARRDLENERARVRELEAELARMRELLEEEQSRRDVNTQDKCAEMHEAVTNNHQEVRAQLGELADRMRDCKDEFSRRDEMEEQRKAEKDARRAQKEAQQLQLQQLLEKMVADQEEERRLADEERQRASERMGLEQVIDELRAQNQEQQRLLVALLDEHRQANLQSHEATVQAVREAVAQHVPMDIKAHLNEFSKSLAEEVRLLLREVGKLREEKRNIQYEIGCMLCLKSKYGPGGEFDPEWRPSTGPCANGPPMPEGTGADPPEERPRTAPSGWERRPAWRTIHQKKTARRREQPAAPPAPPPMQMPSAPAPIPPAPVVSAPPPPPAPSTVHQPSLMQQMMFDHDHDRQQSWYAWQQDPNYTASSPSTAPLYEVPDTRPLGFFGPRSPRDSGI